MSGTFREFDHTGDIGIEAEAPDEVSLYATCARALFDIIAGRAPIETCGSLDIRVEAPDREMLMVRWLNELLYVHATERWIFREFDVAIGEKPDGGRWLEGMARGDRFDPARHALRTELKAVTYHQLSARRDEDGIWRARLVFDI